ncbi:MAG: threonine synthase, partial [Pseudomonadota bacterium]
ISTRGGVKPLDFEDVLLEGLAADGGLFVPETWPEIAHRDIAGLANAPYAAVAFHILKPYLGTMLSDAELEDLLRDTYRDFQHSAVTPLKQIGPGEWLLELFHGPTLAFKDLAMQLLGRLFDIALARRGQDITIIGATSGDTGAAAVEAIRGRKAARVFILHPLGRVSEVQRRQMTTVQDANVHNIAIEGTFDDCQRIVKTLFTDRPFREATNLAGINSINWARAMAQVVYYFVAAIHLGSPNRAVQFSVPTGNFGDILAGYIANKMGLPISQLTIATNVNDILARTLETGIYEPQNVAATLSPSIDIQVSSNFERLLFDVERGRADKVMAYMQDLSQAGQFTLSEAASGAIGRAFKAARVDEDTTLATMRSVYEETGEIIDPHTAVGVAAGRACRLEGLTPLVHLATAHPAKFPDAVERAIGLRPPLPPHLSDLYDRPERFGTLAADVEAVKSHILEASA